MNIIPPVSMVDAGMLDDGLDPKEALSSGMDFSRVGTYKHDKIL